MAEENFVHKTLDKLLEVIEVEFKFPFVIGEVKITPTEIAKEWRENEKKRKELEKAIQRAEEKFVADHKDDKVSKMLHELPLHLEEEFKQVIAGLLTHLSEEKITWLAEVQLSKTWGNIANGEDIRKALELYLPYLRHELSGIKEFREVISALTLERIDETTRRIESKLDQVLDKRISKGEEELDFWFIPHPYPMPPNFTGRVAEQKMLDDWLADNVNRLFILRALGGFGKSALAWQWINTHVNPAEWKKLVWWSFYEGDASFEHFIEETLKYLKLEVPQGTRPQVDELLKAMQSQKTLLIMDGFERALRAYSSMNAAYQGDDEPKLDDNQLDCVNINAEVFLKSLCSLPNIKSKVLMTTRLTPRAVKPRGEFMLGCHEVELTSMQKADAVEFFHKQKIKGTHAEIEVACAPYGFHPLSLRLLAGCILKDFENPADIVVAQKLKIDGDIIQQKHHVLEVSYHSLPKHEQKLLSTIACFRSTVDLKTLQSIAENKDTFDDDLHDLVARGLLHFDERNKKFDLHPIVRGYAYERLTAPNRTAAHTRLIDFFEAIPKPAKVEKLEDLAPVIELYHHMVKAGRYTEASDMYYDRLSSLLYFQFGKYETILELMRALFPNGESELPEVNTGKGFVLNELGNSYCASGQPHHAVLLFIKDHDLCKKVGNKKNLAIGLQNLAFGSLIPTGVLHSAEDNLRQSIDLCREVENIYWEAVGHQFLGYLLTCIGNWSDANEELLTAMKLFEVRKSLQSQSYTASWHSIHFLQSYRWQKLLANPTDANLALATQYAELTLELAKETARVQYPHEQDFMRGDWLLGTTLRLRNQVDLAEHHLSEALTRCRAINNVEHEADILLELAHLRYDQTRYEEAKSLAEEALLITERCGYVLQGGDVNLFLAQYALEQEKDKAKAKEYAEEAKKLATCDGPPYYYKVAYDEGERFLENLK